MATCLALSCGDGTRTRSQALSEEDGEEIIDEEAEPDEPAETDDPIAPDAGGDPVPDAGCSDDDGDGSCNEDDPCPSDPGNDSDGDGTCDGCDPCPSDPLNDSDNDGICDSWDPCLGDDSDGDGICDADDPCPNDPSPDSDGDGICDGSDECPGHNPNDADNNSNGCADCKEVATTSTQTGSFYGMMSVIPPAWICLCTVKQKSCCDSSCGNCDGFNETDTNCDSYVTFYPSGAAACAAHCSAAPSCPVAGCY